MHTHAWRVYKLASRWTWDWRREGGYGQARTHLLVLRLVVRQAEQDVVAQGEVLHPGRLRHVRHGAAHVHLPRLHLHVVQHSLEDAALACDNTKPRQKVASYSHVLAAEKARGPTTWVSLLHLLVVLVRCGVVHNTPCSD